MDALREQILARAAAVLIGTTPAGPNVFRSREVSISREQTPAITVLFDGEQSEPMGDAATRHTMTMLTAVFVRGDPWDSIAATVDVAMHRTLLADQQLAQLVTRIVRSSADPEAEEADKTAGTLSVRFRVTFITRAGDISLAP